MASFLENLAEIDVLTERRQERHLQALRAEEEITQLFESCDAWASSDPYVANRPRIGSAPNDLFQHNFNWHNARPGSRRHGDLPPFYRTEMEHWQLVDTARLLEGLSSTACNVLDVLTQFAIFTGFTYTAVVKDKNKGGPIEEGQEVIDEFIKINDWWSWETEIFRRSRRDGEAFVYLEPDEASGLFLLRAIEPEQVKEPQDGPSVLRRLGADSNMSWKYGILTPRNNTALPEAYWVVSNYSDAQNLGELIPAEEMIHVKTEWVDRAAKRGVSDFFSVANELHGAKKLLRNLRESATVQAVIAWIREHPEGSPPSRPTTTNPANVSRSGEIKPSVTYDSPMMLDVKHGTTYHAGPLGSGHQTVLVEVLQAALRSIGARWQMPEALISGDSSNANLASALVAEGPFVRAMAYRQWHYRQSYRAVMERVIEHAAATGKLGSARDTILDQIDISVETPPVIPRKANEETARNEILFSNGIMSKQSWAAREDLDYEEEVANMEADPSTLSPEEEAEQQREQGEQERELALIRHGASATTSETETEAERVT